MAYDIALEKALKAFRELNPYVAASKSATDYAESAFHIKFFNRDFLLHYPEGRLSECGSEDTPPQWLHIILLHYLIQADGTRVADHWIAYRHLPGAGFFERRFMNMAVNPLTKAFGNDLEGFKRGGLALGGEAITRTGDAAFRFLALPKIPIACILYLGDEDVRPSVNVLFDESASAYLPTEDLSLLGVYINGAMKKYRSSG